MYFIIPEFSSVKNSSLGKTDRHKKTVSYVLCDSSMLKNCSLGKTNEINPVHHVFCNSKRTPSHAEEQSLGKTK